MSDIQKLIKDIAEASGIFVEDIKMSETGGTIKVICDTEEGISSSILVSISKKILNDPVYEKEYAERFRLEVSSPGIDTHLTLPRHFRKNIGHNIVLQYRNEEHNNPIKGTITDVDEDAVYLAVKKKKENETLRIPFKEIEYASIVLKW
ncbi:MAG: hypothetical protein KAT14_06765 [Candidatus Marinimicrobia bacterium]|nr:hypothetical protein [Candidatus Neomarinimicrobiota bacterium]